MYAKLQIISIILINVAQLRAECNVCSAANQMACVSETTYQFCVNNIPSGAVNACPPGYVCSTTTAVICRPNAADVVATCDSCNKCDANLVFACTGVNTFALCLGQATPSTTLLGTCDANQVCSLTSQYICASSTTVAATCPTANETSSESGATSSTSATTASTSAFTTSTATQTYAQRFCSLMRVSRRFRTPSEIDNSCRRYITCIRTLAGTWSGQMYTCVGATFFDPVLLYCVTTRPSSC